MEATWRGLAGKFLKAAYLNRRGASLQSRLPQRKEKKTKQKLGRKNKTRRRNRQGRERAKKDGPGREGPAGPAGPAGKKVTEGGERAESFFAEPFETPPPIRLLFLQGVRSGGAPTSAEETCLPACMHARTPSVYFREPWELPRTEVVGGLRKSSTRVCVHESRQDRVTYSPSDFPHRGRGAFQRLPKREHKYKSQSSHLRLRTYSYERRFQQLDMI